MPQSNNKPREHHFVPQSWIKRFADPVGELWAYDWDKDKVEKRSASAVMKLYDLYTIDPGGVDDTSLETGALGVIDNALGQTLKAVHDGARDSETKKALASYLSAQVMRDPEVVAGYADRAAELTVSLIDIVRARDYASFAQTWAATFPGASITEPEFDHMSALGEDKLTTDIDAIVAAVTRPGGTAELPFTDIVESPDGRAKIYDCLMAQTWIIKRDPAGGFILGDTGALFDKADMSNGLRAPLGRGLALYVTPAPSPASDIADSQAEPWEVEGLNAESAARARKWLVGAPEQLEPLRQQIRGRGFPGRP